MDSKVFVDSDVVISSQISSKGAAYHLIYKTNIHRIITDKSIDEIERVAKELELKIDKDLVRKFTRIDIAENSEDKIRGQYQEYSQAPNDLHIIAGADLSKSKFLITYNKRDFNAERIKKNLEIIVMTPAQFLQYLRSLK